MSEQLLSSCLLRRTPCMKYSLSSSRFLFFCFSFSLPGGIYAEGARIRLAFASLVADLSRSFRDLWKFSMPHLTFCRNPEQICNASARFTTLCGWIFLHNFRDSTRCSFCILILDHNLISLFIRRTLLSLADWHGCLELAIGASHIWLGGVFIVESSSSRANVIF